MSRIACLLVPDFPLAALLRAEPELRGSPVAVTDGYDSRAPLLAVSREAEAHGVRSGLSVAQARAISAALVIRRVTGECLRAADDALLDVTDSFSPRVESRGGGIVFLDLDGLAALFGSEQHLATLIAARTRRIGLEAAVGIASTRASAVLAARCGEGVEILSPRDERERLAPLPVSLLDPSPELATALERWGIRTLGDLVRLPGRALGQHLGAEGLALWRKARGEDDAPFTSHARSLRFEEAVDCEYAIDSFEPLSFLLRAALERLVARLDIRGLRAGDLELVLRLAGGGSESRVVRVAAPTHETKVLLALMRVNVESHPPRGAIESFRLGAVPERLRPVELDLFAPAGPSPEALDAALARLVAIAGNDRVGRPVAADSHRPEAFALDRFAPSPATPPAGGNGHSTPPFSPLALRAFRPPAPIQVVSDRARPDFVQGEGAALIGGRVVTLAGPWRLAGEWWSSEPLARDYYDVELTDGCVYRIYREHESGRWYAAGVYD